MTSTADPKSVARDSFRLIETGNEQLAQRIVAAGFVNHEAQDDPEDGGIGGTGQE
jgi:hypothetical protein